VYDFERGWLCLAVRAKFTVCILWISPPMRVFYDQDGLCLFPGTAPDCGTESAARPDGCGYRTFEEGHYFPQRFMQPEPGETVSPLPLEL
jgi:hypothetical protein